MKFIIYLLCLFSYLTSSAQSGVIKGKIIDKQSEGALFGVTVELLNQGNSPKVTTDEKGYFRLENVPLGRQSIRIGYLGYETISLPNIIVSSGKDAIVNLALEESFASLEEVVVSAGSPKDRAINTMTTVSARQFGMEEVTRFSGGRSDVGRLAANFAGVSAPGDSRNDIVVRGNSPSGLLYRLEGIPIPNPNHFTTVGTTGGATSAINPNLLKNSDFLTSAFPAEYGNALGGVFDLGFRTGNKDEYEYTAQLGIFSGLEALAEGPLGKKNGSFIIAARYSITGLLGVGGAGGTSAVPNYSDLSMNIDFGEGDWGNFSLFGIFGASDIEFLGDEVEEGDLFAREDENSSLVSNVGVIGLKHRINTSENTYLNTTLSTTLYRSNVDMARYMDKNQPDERLIDWGKNDNREMRFIFSTYLNSKLSKNISLRTGVLFERMNVEAFLQSRDEQPDRDGDGDPDLFTFRDIDENLNIIQPYTQMQYRLSEKITLNGGLHGQYSSLNGQFVLEPRAGLSYQMAGNHTLSLGYGMHHQPIPIPILFLSQNINGEYVRTNTDLDFVRSQHYVFGYDVRIAPNWRGKMEVYYQDIDKAAVEPFPSSYSTLTEGASFTFDNDRVSLVNEGTGFNRGIEFTLEKFFSDGYYGLLTTSLFESKYKGSDGTERNSPFNNRYVVNLLGGREFNIGRDGKNILFVDTRLSMAGGRYYTPIDLSASQQAGYEILEEGLAFSEQYGDYLRWDVKFGIRLNSRTKKQSHQFYIDLQNVTNRGNPFIRRYNRITGVVDQLNQIGFFPDFGYRFQF